MDHLSLVSLVAMLAIAGCNTSPRTTGPVASDNTSPRTTSASVIAKGQAAGSRVTGAEARALVERGALLIDVRTPEEFAADAIPGAKNVPHDQMEARAHELGPNDRPVVVYCRSGGRSKMAASTLGRLGFTQIYDLGPRSAW